MLSALAALLVRKNIAWATVVIVVLATAFLGAQATRVQRDDSLLAFLPQDNADIKVFKDVNGKFGGLDVALVGVGSADALAPEFLGRLQHATKKLNETKGVGYVLSLANVDDFAPDAEKGGINTDTLVPAKLPTTPAEVAALREKVLSRDQVVGNLVSADGKAVVIYCFLAVDVDPKESAARVRSVVEASFPEDAKYWGGLPFIQGYIFGVTQQDLNRLTPWACAVILAIAFWAFRDAIGTLIALFTTAAGIAAALGLMALFDVKTNLVLGSMPVILFALGSAYPIHMLVRYYAVVKEMGRDKAIEHIVVYLGPTVIASGLTAAGGLLSFVAMDIQPIRTFGLFTGLGVLTTLLLSVTFVPALIRIADLKARISLDNHTSQGMIRFCTAMGRNRTVVGVGLVAVATAAALFVGRIDSRVDNSSFYTRTSPPARAEGFLREYFGGSQFFQVAVEGDMADPGVLRVVRGLADRIALVPHVSSVTHVGSVIAKINEAMEGDERIPDTAAKVKLLYGFLEGKKAVSQLVTDDHAHGLLQVKVDTDRAAELETVLADVEAAVAAEAPKVFSTVEVSGPRHDEARARVEAMVLARIRAAAQLLGAPLADAQVTAVTDRLHAHGAVKPADTKPIEAAILAFLGSEEFMGEIPKTLADGPRRVAAALAGLGARPTKDAVAAALAGALERPASDAVVLDLAATLKKPVNEILRRQVALADARQLVADAHVALPAGAKAERLVTAVGAAIMDLDVDRIVLPAAAGVAGTAGTPLGVTVTGQPVLNRGLSESVDRNQLKSFFMAMGLVLVICLTLYRSLWSALLAMTPVTLTLLMVYGGMGLLGVHLDIGTSMLASLTTGAGVDYAVHLLAAWKGPPGQGKATRAELDGAASYAAFLVGRAIWTNALMVAGGFIVLTMGEARPLQNVGGLTAAAMMAAALATFAAIPAFARKRAYDKRPRIAEILRPSDGAEAAPPAEGSPSPSISRGSP